MPALRHRRHDDLLVERPAGSLNVAVGGRKGAPTIVLVHGLSTSWRIWKPLLPSLVRDYHVVAPDLPGFGASDDLPTPEYELESVAGAIAGALDELGVKNHTLVGHSLGGGISVVYAAAYRERVDALGLIAPAGFLRYPGYVRLAWRSSLLHRAGRGGARVAQPLLWVSGKARNIAISRIVHDPSIFAARDLVHLVHATTHARAAGPAGIAIVGTSLFERLPQLTMPSLLIWGENDRVVPPFRADEIAALLPDCRELVMLPETGHLPIWERPGAVSDAVLDLLRDAAEQRGEQAG